MRRKLCSDAALAEARRFYEGGGSLAKAAVPLGMSASTLRNWAKEDGWLLRPPSPGVAAASAAAVVSYARRRAEGAAAVDRVALAAKLRASVEGELAAAERALGRRGKRGEAERAARTLASLVRTLNELRRLDAPAPGAEEPDEPFADLDSLRRELARRLAGLGAGGAG